jgi:drug/metabolite transporter (DMT)-like permease
MNVKRIAGLILVVVGVVFLVTRGFTYTKDTHKAKLGPIDFSVKEKERVSVPAWAGVVAVAAGVALLVLPKRKG